MKFKRKRKLHAGRLDIAPLVDVVLLLIIFFMLTSSFISPLGLDIELPASSQARPQEKENLMVVIAEDGVVTINENTVEPEELKNILIREKSLFPERILIIKADRDTDHGSVVTVMSTAREIGWNKMAIAADSQPPRQPDR